MVFTTLTCHLCMIDHPLGLKCDCPTQATLICEAENLARAAKIEFQTTWFIALLSHYIAAVTTEELILIKCIIVANIVGYHQPIYTKHGLVTYITSAENGDGYAN